MTKTKNEIDREIVELAARQKFDLETKAEKEWVEDESIKNIVLELADEKENSDRCRIEEVLDFIAVELIDGFVALYGSEVDASFVDICVYDDDDAVHHSMNTLEEEIDMWATEYVGVAVDVDNASDDEIREAIDNLARKIRSKLRP